ncbi:dirigent protein 22-like [Macadamia integrifolia]|uniref:dirigent protein 22-like n=1 Tax=Macadamia integrifolia TaxID=60698 RepID=UPI001C4EC34A|nr:dirigent protein 22-like [Macadamia integrifolia]
MEKSRTPSKLMISSSITIFSISILFSNVALAGNTNHQFCRELSISKFEEKLTHLRFYYHNLIKITNAQIVSGNSSTGFGRIDVVDAELREGPETNSKLVGRVEGLELNASQGELGLLMVISFAFTEGKYNGSTLSMLGRNLILREVREMPLVGGTGLFRFARGYAQARTVLFNSSITIVQFDFSVIHY